MKPLIMTIAIVLCLGLFLSTQTFASEESIVGSEVCKAGETFECSMDKDEVPVSANDVHWDFITCTHDQHECSHEATQHGYHHYRAVHDSHMCSGHAHYACYGGHH